MITQKKQNQLSVHLLVQMSTTDTKFNLTKKNPKSIT